MPDRSFASTFKPALAAAALAAASAFVLLFSGCVGSGPVPAPTAKNVEYAGRNGQVTTLATLKVGRNLYVGRCSACHALKDPKDLAPADWPEMVQRMASNAKLTADQERAVTQYLVSVSAIAHDTASAAAAGPGTETPHPQGTAPKRTAGLSGPSIGYIREREPEGPPSPRRRRHGKRNGILPRPFP
ncbi:MAG TPA: cytochrome c [Fibrobacteria bacterium]|nr:cytochrome c [Fibrobacteria bacterium]